MRPAPARLTRLHVIPVAFVMALGLAGPALAQKSGVDLLKATDVEELVNISKGFGSSSLTKDDGGDPLIKNRTDGIAWSIYFYGCTNGADCSSIQMSTGFEMKTKPTLDKINNWNFTKRWAKARLDKESDPVISLDINMRSGIPRANLESTITVWIDSMKEFATFIGYKK
jgi:Putative bacterial sensory transduction regulator